LLTKSIIPYSQYCVNHFFRKEFNRF
jgi:hypothetical protein